MSYILTTNTWFNRRKIDEVFKFYCAERAIRTDYRVARMHPDTAARRCAAIMAYVVAFAQSYSSVLTLFLVGPSPPRSLTLKFIIESIFSHKMYHSCPLSSDLS